MADYAHTDTNAAVEEFNRENATPPETFDHAARNRAADKLIAEQTARAEASRGRRDASLRRAVADLNRDRER